MTDQPSTQEAEGVCPGCGNTMRPYDEAGTPYCLDEYHDRPTQWYRKEQVDAALRSLRTQHTEQQAEIAADRGSLLEAVDELAKRRGRIDDLEARHTKDQERAADRFVILLEWHNERCGGDFARCETPMCVKARATVEPS
jgi:hypothetical protein